MLRRAFLLTPALLIAQEKDRSVYDFFGEVASALSEDNAIAFMKLVDSAMKDRAQLQANIAGLLGQAQVLSSIEVLREEGDNQRRTVDLDWFLQILERTVAGQITRRRRRVHAVIQRNKKKKWVIAELAPIELFEPLRPPKG